MDGDTLTGKADELNAVPTEGQAADTGGVVEGEGAFPDVVTVLAEYPATAVITEAGLGKLLHRHPLSIRRAAARGDLPPSFRWFNGNAWLAGAIVEHLQGLQERATRDRERVLRKIS